MIAHHLHPPINPSRTLAHLPRRMVEELVLVVPPLLHIPRGGATYFDLGRPCYVHGARCSAPRACAASAHWCAPSHTPSIGRTLLSKACVLATDHVTLFLSPAWCLLKAIALLLNGRSVLDRTSISKTSALASGHAAVRYLLLGRSRNSRRHILQGPRRASVTTRCAPKHPPRQPFWPGALRAAASPPRPHASEPPLKQPDP